MEFTVVSTKCQSTYSVQLEENKTYQCTCGTPQEMGHPCRHIFVVLKFKKTDLYQPELIADWKEGVFVGGQ